MRRRDQPAWRGQFDLEGDGDSEACDGKIGRRVNW
jgi:hypothetical protein